MEKRWIFQRKKDECPLDGNCLQAAVIYQAKVTRTDNNTHGHGKTLSYSTKIVLLIQKCYLSRKVLQL